MDSNSTSAQASANASLIVDDKFFLPGITYDDVLDKDILELLGLKDLSDDEAKEIYDKMFQTIQDRVILDMVEKMSDEDFASLETAVEAKNKDKFEELVTKNHIDVVNLYAQEALAYKIELINLVQGPKTAKED
jgi:hypothetical protein